MANLVPRRPLDAVRRGVYVTQDQSGNPSPTGLPSDLAIKGGVNIRLFLFSLIGYNVAAGRIGF